MTALGAMTVPLPIEARGPMTTPASMIAPDSTCADGSTWACGETPVSPVMGPGVAAAGKRGRPTIAKACGGRGGTKTAAPDGAFPENWAGQKTAAAFSDCISVKLRLP